MVEQVALIVGRAKAVWDDLTVAYSMRPENCRYVTIAVNVVGCHLPVVDHWVSFHPELMVHWIAERRNNDYADGYQLWTSSRGRHMTEWEKKMKIRMVDCEGGSSGMIGLKVALEIGAPKMLLAGIPMVNEAGRYDVSTEWDEAEMHLKAWQKLDASISNRIRSLSGKTMELFGYPTKEWLGQNGKD